MAPVSSSRPRGTPEEAWGHSQPFLHRVEQGRPLLRAQLGGQGADGKIELPCQPLELQGRQERPQRCSQRRRHGAERQAKQPDELVPFAGRQQRRIPPKNGEHGGVLRGDGSKATRRQSTAQVERPPGRPREAEEVGRASPRPLPGHLPLDDQIHAPKSGLRLVEQLMQKSSGNPERDVSEHSVGTAGIGEAEDVPPNNPYVSVPLEPTVKQTRQLRVQFHRDHASRQRGELPGEPSRARPDLQDEIARANARPSDELGG